MQESKVIAIIISVLTLMIIGAVSLFIYAFFHLNHKKNNIAFSNNVVNQDIVFHVPYQENIISITDTHVCPTCLLIVTGKHMVKSHIFIVDVNTGHIKNFLIKR